ncbi:hypothetical protein CVIRNUC_010175 [Coccomyxa viridis]|uniref:S-acyltransferase n=1 Tax=Coccomyxa viridis TaxID=1274662 RepID=A0AAV1II03_9CHLO|nr:hypothetical protein CVIRNUC_010175 [Coccomyxa viridis]
MSWNAFELCSGCLKHLGKIMILVVSAFVVLTAAAMLDAYGPCVGHAGAGEAAGCFTGLLAFFFLVVMLMWSYFAALLTEPGRVPSGWSPFPSDEEAQLESDRAEVGSQEQGKGVAGSGRPRYCRKCHAWKPERAHHDSMAGRCVLKMDHYCVWIANTVGLCNYKAFLLFLFYTFWACALAAAMLLSEVVHFFKGLDTVAPEKSSRFALTLLAFIVDIAFALSLGGLLGMHARMVWLNVTTIEMFEKQRVTQWPFDRGPKRNFQQVFGISPWRWWLPTHTKLERARMLDAALAQQPSEAAMGTEFAVL